MAEGSRSADERGMDRFVAFGDAVFAFAITLLALDIRLPQTAHYSTDAALRHALLGLVPQYAAYVLSFAVVGSFWMSHHRKFRVITRYDATLIRIDLMLLMMVVTVPAVTSLLGEYPYRTAVTLYAATMGAIAFFSLLLSWYGLRHGLVLRRPTPLELRQLLRQPALVAGVFLISIILAQWNAQVAMWSWLILLPVSLTLRVRAASRDAAAKTSGAMEPRQ
jgi:TMEM175 potassium channel family protein